MAIRPTERELDLAQWIYTMTLGGIADLVLDALNEIGEPPSKWRFIQRRRWWRKFHSIIDAFHLIKAEQNKQEAAS